MKILEKLMIGMGVDRYGIEK